MVLDLTLTALLISLLIKSEAELLNGAKTLCSADLIKDENKPHKEAIGETKEIVYLTRSVFNWLVFGGFVHSNHQCPGIRLR
jgi:hypothetical protein